MIQTIIRTLAAILILISVIKIIFILKNPQAWLNFVKKIYRNVKVIQTIFFIISAVLLFLLLQARIDILKILAVSLFMAFFIGAGIAPYMKKIIKNIKVKTILKDNWVYTVAWLLLLGWGLIALI